MKKIDLNYKKFDIEYGWGLEGTGMKGTYIGDSLNMQGYAHDYKTVEKIANKIMSKKKVSERVEKNMKELDAKLDNLFVEESLDLNEQIKNKTKKTSGFTLGNKGRRFTHHYAMVDKILYAFDKKGKKIKNSGRIKIKYYFIPDVLTHLFLPLDKDPFNNKNEKFKKGILKNLDPNKNEWQYLLDLEMPNSMYVCDKSYYRERWNSLEAAKELDFFETKKKLKVYKIISNRESLLEVYNSQIKDAKLIDEKNFVFEYANEKLPKNKAFHGIMIC